MWGGVGRRQEDVAVRNHPSTAAGSEGGDQDGGRRCCRLRLVYPPIHRHSSEPSQHHWVDQSGLKYCSYKKPPEVEFSRNFVEDVSRQQSPSLFEPELVLGAEVGLKLETCGLALEAFGPGAGKAQCITLVSGGPQRVTMTSGH